MRRRTDSGPRERCQDLRALLPTCWLVAQRAHGSMESFKNASQCREHDVGITFLLSLVW